MNRIYLIGNGFDCAHKLNTRYSDFLFWYCKNSISKAKTENKTYEDSFITAKVISYSNLDLESIRTWDDIKENINRKLSPNTSAMLNALSSSSIGNFHTNHNITPPKFELIIKSAFAKSIINNCIDAGWVDIEKAFYSALLDSAKITTSKPKESIDELNSVFDTLIKKLREYLETIDTNIKNESILRLFDLNSIADKDFSLPRKYLIVCFNYTKTVEKYIRNEHFTKDFGLEYQLVYIHGNTEDSINPIIFGYGDETDKHFSTLEDLDDSRFTKYFKSNGYGLTPNYRLISDFIDKLEFDVYVLGHSCGSSDKVLLKAIFDNINCKEIKILHHEKENGSNDFIDIYQNISRCFSKDNRHSFRRKTINYSKTNCMPQM